MNLAYRSRVFSHVCTFLMVVFIGGATAKDRHNSTPVVRWGEGQPGCTFSLDDDGKYRFCTWSDDFGVVLVVDSQEVQKGPQNGIEPLFGVGLKFRYRGQQSVTTPDRATLEFVKHKRVIHRSFD